ncbi:unnamed protein product [Vitrella brassicaformis CCMP3155]|uniref:Beta-galactosidase n=2 Tax=Vitrella brassicaformis TaxID=1169539 RepID=A0A0G4H0J4_VITBC|nr:unnamed protein product [Vitrella brassicaformis CCMP3155]|eukprot:CEM37061.1 unnamed protein product [Vitrella brassicaformis CCMP3155]
MAACRVLYVVLVLAVAASEPSFRIDHESDVFLLDGEPFQYAAGEVLYSRIPRSHWRPLMRLIHDGGLNAIQVYVPWNFHEVRAAGNRHEYDFTGDKDLVHFIEAAGEEGLFVLLRPGPYICAEWDYGGLPSRLLTVPDIRIRSSDKRYMDEVREWFEELLPRVKPLLYVNGGPILMVQIENEYGSYSECDKDYLKTLEDLLRSHLGDDVVLYTTDGPDERMLKCGSTPTSFTTIDFGPSKTNVEELHQLWRRFQPTGPFVNSELYAGWFDHWGEEHHRVDSKDLMKMVKTLWNDYGASISFYMMHGGTNFDAWNGANIRQGVYQPTTTSYDYDAPISEAGRPREKWLLLQEFLVPNERVTPVWRKSGEYGTVTFEQAAHLTDALNASSIRSLKGDTPMTLEAAIEELGLPQTSPPVSLVAYRHTITQGLVKDKTEYVLHLCGLHDRAHVYVDGVMQGIASRQMSAPSHWEKSDQCGGGPDSVAINVTIPTPTTEGVSSPPELLVVVESLGRINYVNWRFVTSEDSNPMLTDLKGITGSVYLDQQPLTGAGSWATSPLPLTLEFLTSSLKYHKPSHQDRQGKVGPLSLFKGSVSLPGKYPRVKGRLPDTFLDMSENGWSKGVAFINGFSLGRYWNEAGPQKRLYVPGSLLHIDDTNELILLDTDGPSCEQPPCSFQVRLISEPIEQDAAGKIKAGEWIPGQQELSLRGAGEGEDQQLVKEQALVGIPLEADDLSADATNVRQADKGGKGWEGFERRGSRAVSYEGRRREKRVKYVSGGGVVREEGDQGGRRQHRRSKMDDIPLGFPAVLGGGVMMIGVVSVLLIFWRQYKSRPIDYKRLA